MSDPKMTPGEELELERMCTEPVYHYPFGGPDVPVEIWKDNTKDQHLFVLGELCTFEHEWEKDIKD